MRSATRYRSLCGLTSLLMSATAFSSPNTAGWSQKPTPVFPFGSGSFETVYDSSHSRLLVLDDAAQMPGISNRTFLWDGHAWTNAAPNPPGHYLQRSGELVAYDAARAEVVLFGGLNTYDSSPLNDTWVWDGGAWIQEHPAHVPSYGSGAMAYDAARQQIVLFTGQYNDETWLWDGNDWIHATPSVSPPTPVNGVSMGYDAAHSQVVLFENILNPPNGGLFGYETWVWDGSNWTQKFPANNPPVFSGKSMAFDPTRGQLVLFGSDFSPAPPYPPDTEIWDGQNWIRAPLTNTPAPGCANCLVYDDALGKLVLLTQPHAVPELWTLQSTNWSEVPQNLAPPPVANPAMAYDAVRQLTVLFDNGTWTWDGTVWKLQSPPVSPQSVAGMEFDAVHGQTILLDQAGGTWAWDGMIWTQLNPATGPPARNSTLMVWDSARQQIVLFGGVAPVQFYGTPPSTLNDTWVWDGSTWTQKFPAQNPPAGDLMAYDVLHSRAVLLTSDIQGTSLAFDTWLWDGVNWTKTSGSAPDPSFSPVFAPAGMTYDAAHGLVVMLRAEGSVWTWNGDQWFQTTAASAPPYRQFTSMVWDAARRQIVLFGGIDNSSGERVLETIYGDTWVRDGGLLATSNGFLYSRVTRAWIGTVQLTNVGTQPVSGPFALVLHNLPGSVQVLNATGLSNGHPFFTVNAGTIAPGSSVSVSVQLSEAAATTISFDAETFAGVQP